MILLMEHHILYISLILLFIYLLERENPLLPKKYLFCFRGFFFFFQRAEPVIFSHKSVSGEQPSIVVMYHNIIISVGLSSLNLAFRILDVHHCLGSELKMRGENKKFCIHVCELSRKSFIALLCQMCSVPDVAR